MWTLLTNKCLSINSKNKSNFPRPVVNLGQINLKYLLALSWKLSSRASRCLIATGGVEFTFKQKALCYEVSPVNTQRTTTLLQRRCNVVTLQRRCGDVVCLLEAGHNISYKIACAPSKDSFARSDQSIPCVPEDVLAPWLPTVYAARTLFRVRDNPNYSWYFRFLI